jgi:hypothetical protein
MRRVLFVSVVLALLLGTAGTAFAQKNGCGEEPTYPDAQLGEIWWFVATGYDPFERVDVHLYRPSTLGYEWPWQCPVDDAEVVDDGPYYGDFFASAPATDPTEFRQTFPAWRYANNYGAYYGEFMLPREDTWYPCDWPFQWKCNWVWFPGVPDLLHPVPPDIEWHSPADQGNFEFPLIWPWYDEWVLWITDGDLLAAFGAANPMDTVAPLEAIVYSANHDPWRVRWEITGYYWKWTDLNDGWTPIGLP